MATRYQSQVKQNPTPAPPRGTPVKQQPTQGRYVPATQRTVRKPVASSSTSRTNQGANRNPKQELATLQGKANAISNNPRVPSRYKTAAQSAVSGKSRQEPGGLFGFLHKVPGIKQGLEVLASEPVQWTLNKVDFPRAAVVSGVKEFADAMSSGSATGDASWNDFWQQTQDRIGFGDVWHDVAVQEGNKWAQNRVVELLAGITGDVGLDPLTYLGGGIVKDAVAKGSEAVAEEGGRTAAKAIAKGTTRRGLAVSVADRAGELGLDSPSIDNLIADIGTRGVDASTTSRLARSGVSKDTARQLGLPEFQARLGVHGHTVPIPGSRPIAEGLANVRGAIKSRAVATSFAGRVRQARVFEGDLANEIAATQTLLSGSGKVADRANAARVLAAADKARGGSGAVADRIRRVLHNDVKPHAKELRHDPASIIGQIEGDIPVTSKAAEAVKGVYDYAFNAAKEEGVDLGYLDNYFPHRLHPDMKAAVQAGREELLPYIDQVAGKRRFTFEMKRRLKPGEVFLGEKLEKGTVAEVNDIGMRKLGMKVLDDDVASVTAKYIDEVAGSVQQQILLKKLVDVGAAEPLTAKVVSKEVVPEGKKILAKKIDKAAEARAREVKASYSRITDTKGLNSKRIRTVLNSKRNDLVSQKFALAREAKAAEDAVTRAGDAVTRAASRVETAQAAEEAARRAASSARRTVRKTANARLARVEKELATRQAEHAATKAELEAAVKNTEEMGSAAQRMEQLSTIMDGLKVDAETQRAVLAAHSGPVLPDEVKTAVESTRAAKDSFAAIQHTYEQALDFNATVAATHPQVMAQVETQLANLSDVLKHTKVPKGFKAKPKTWRDARLMSHRADTRLQIMKDYMKANPDDEVARQIAKIETDVSVREVQAAMGGIKTAKLENFAETLRTPEVQQIIQYQVDKGMKAITDKVAGGLQADPFVDQLLRVQREMKNPQWWDGLVAHYDSFNNWFKAWAVASPGFLSRNAYAGVFNNYVAGIPMKAYWDFRKMYSIYYDNPRTYEKLIGEKWGPEELRRFHGSLEAIAASGWGQTNQEVMMALFPKRSINPLRADNVVTRPIRRVNEGLETWMRGAHAYGVMQRGGSVQDAIEGVTRWHFNYRDLSSFDKAMKRPIPFWVFMSRNIPLQVDVLTHSPQLINRTYGNIKRNLERETNGEPIVPSYYHDLGAIHLPFQVPGLNKDAEDYFVPDLPILRLQEDLTKAGDPIRLMSDANPAVRLPLELRAGKQFYSDVPLTGDYEPAPSYATVPGIQELLNAAGLLKKDAEGNAVMRQRDAYIVDSLAVPLSRARRLLPADRDERFDSRQGASLLSFVGIGVKSNTPTAQRSEVFRRQRALQSVSDELKQLGYSK